MSIKIKEVRAKSVLTSSGISGVDYCLNPYVGCAHGCTYCYATFMKKFTGHTEKWGRFVDAKINSPEILRKQLKRADKGSILISSVTDPYQPIEARYKLTRQCLDALIEYQKPVSILTKSPLVLRDMDLFRMFNDIEVGMTITTNDEGIKKIFEPDAPPISERINTLKTLFENGIKTYVFIGPVLPMDPDNLVEKLYPYINSFIIDRMNYVSKTKGIYKYHRLTQWLDSNFLNKIVERLNNGFSKIKVNPVIIRD